MKNWLVIVVLVVFCPMQATKSKLGGSGASDRPALQRAKAQRNLQEAQQYARRCKSFAALTATMIVAGAVYKYRSSLKEKVAQWYNKLRGTPKAPQE